MEHCLRCSDDCFMFWNVEHLGDDKCAAVSWQDLAAQLILFKAVVLVLCEATSVGVTVAINLFHHAPQYEHVGTHGEFSVFKMKDTQERVVKLEPTYTPTPPGLFSHGLLEVKATFTGSRYPKDADVVVSAHFVHLKSNDASQVHKNDVCFLADLLCHLVSTKPRLIKNRVLRLVMGDWNEDPRTVRSKLDALLRQKHPKKDPEKLSKSVHICLTELSSTMAKRISQGNCNDNIAFILDKYDKYRIAVTDSGVVSNRSGTPSQTICPFILVSRWSLTQKDLGIKYCTFTSMCWCSDM
jgi:hypothetical protein